MAHPDSTHPQITAAEILERDILRTKQVLLHERNKQHRARLCRELEALLKRRKAMQENAQKCGPE